MPTLPTPARTATADAGPSDAAAVDDLVPSPGSSGSRRGSRARAGPHRSPRRVVAAGILGLAAAVVVGTAVAVRPRGSPTASRPGARVLPDLSAAPPGPEEAARARAETSVHAALLPAAELRARWGDLRAVSPHALARLAPDLSFVAGDVASTGPTTVSVGVPTAHRIVVAASAETGVCAFARDDGRGVEAVTVRSDRPCAADRAPATGWDDGSASGPAPDVGPAGTHGAASTS